jgi:hypothetical protein
LNYASIRLCARHADPWRERRLRSEYFPEPETHSFRSRGATQPSPNATNSRASREHFSSRIQFSCPARVLSSSFKRFDGTLIDPVQHPSGGSETDLSSHRLAGRIGPREHAERYPSRRFWPAGDAITAAPVAAIACPIKCGGICGGQGLPNQVGRHGRRPLLRPPRRSPATCTHRPGAPASSPCIFCPFRRPRASSVPR